MRDILVTLAIFGILPLIFWRARYGAYAWAWIAMMVPHRAAYGFARNLPFAQLVALCTLIAVLGTKEKRKFPFTNLTVTWILFLLWMSFTCLFAMHKPAVVQAQWVVVLKIHLMIFVSLLLIRGRGQIEALIWIVTLSIGFYGMKGGIFTLLTGGGGRVWGPSGGVIQGNNELGIALVIVTPFMYYLRQIAPKAWMRTALTVGMGFMLVGILGTQSRGALLAVLSMALVLGLKGKYPIQTTLGLAAVMGLAVLFMPDSWTNRMHTIGTYSQDTSAMSRIYVWKTLWNLALDRPFVGAGFATDNPLVFALYGPRDMIVSGYDFLNGKVLVAHSIYFQALGEHGFPGLILYALLGFFTWRRAGQLARITADDPEFKDWVPMLMRMCQVSVFGFAVGGTFLTLVHFDLPYYIVAYVVLVDCTVRERDAEQKRQRIKAQNEAMMGIATRPESGVVSAAATARST